jgi:uracil-DNA glycosylase family 4
MNTQDYQKNVLMELMNIEEFIIKTNKNESNEVEQPSINKKISHITSVNPYSANNINDLTSIIKEFLRTKSLKIPDKELILVEGNIKSKILFLYSYCNYEDSKIIDGEEGVLFDKMLKGINLSREDISLVSFIPRQLETFKDHEEFNLFNQLMNYKLIELLDPKYLIILGNFTIKMLLASDLSSMSLRGKWFDFNTPNDIIPKKTRVLYEPRMLISNPDLKKDAWQDLKDIRAQIGG